MPVLAWESGYVELKCPGKLNVGRGPTNEYQPESQSVSKLHAILELIVGNGGRIDCFLEDLNSRNGTFIGPEPGDMEKLTPAMGKRKIKYGDYIRFGNANSFHRFLEYPPADLETARVEIKEQPAPIADTIIPATREVSSDPLHNSDLFRNDHNMAMVPSMYHPPPRHQGPSPQNSNSNMTVSVNYPTMQMAPVSVTIDPGLINNQAAGGGYGAPMMGAYQGIGNPTAAMGGYGYQDMGGYPMGYQQAPRGYPGMQGGYSDPYAGGIPYIPQHQAPSVSHQPNPPVVHKPDFEIINPSPISKSGDDYGRTNRYDNVVDYPPLEHSNWDPQHEGRRRNKDSFLDDAIAMLQNDKSGGRKKHLSSIAESPRRLEQSLNSLNSLYAANKVYKPTVRGDVVNLLLPSTPDVALVVKEIIGNEIETEQDDDMIKMARAYDSSKDKKGKKKQQPEIPPNIATEILVEDMCEENTTVLYHFNSAMSELNDLLKRSYAGMQLDPKGLQTSAEFDILLQGLTNSMLEGAIKALQNVRNSNLVTAFSVAQKSGFKNYVEPIITTSSVRLVRLLAFESNEFLASESHSLNQYEMYEVAAFVLNKVVAELDLAGGFMFKITAEVLGLPPLIDSKVSAELEELRKLKALQKGKVVEEVELSDEERARKFVDGLCLWLVRRRFIFWRKKTEILRVAGIRHSKIKKFYRSMRQAMTRCLIKPFHKWLRYANKAGAMNNSDMEIARLRNELYAATTRMHEIERKDEIASLLTAERAFNRELSAANREMRASILDLETKLLECASGPINMRKMMVRDVLLKREEEVAFARREARSLKEELNQLYQTMGTPALEENKNNRVFVRKGPSQVTPISPERGNAPEPNHNHMALQEYLRKVSKEKKDPGSHPVFHEGMSRVIAKLVVLHEVRRMRVAYKKVLDEKNELKAKLVDSTLRNTQLTESLQILQMRLSRREISQGALRTLLLQRLGDKGIAELIDSLEDLGAGKDCLLKDTVPLQLHQVDTDNEDENPEITRDDDMFFEDIEDDENINKNDRFGNATPRVRNSKPTPYGNAVNQGVYGSVLDDSML